MIATLKLFPINELKGFDISVRDRTLLISGAHAALR
jgi:hypothetical protein